jgi:hypothetical protein
VPGELPLASLAALLLLGGRLATVISLGRCFVQCRSGTGLHAAVDFHTRRYRAGDGTVLVVLLIRSDSAPTRCNDR